MAHWDWIRIQGVPRGPKGNRCPIGIGELREFSDNLGFAHGRSLAESKPLARF
jgi:hypothetical protein